MGIYSDENIYALIKSYHTKSSGKIKTYFAIRNTLVFTPVAEEAVVASTAVAVAPSAAEAATFHLVIEENIEGGIEENMEAVARLQ